MLGKSLDEGRENATLRVQQQGARSDVAPGEKGSVVKSHRGRAAVTGADRFLRKPLLTSRDGREGRNRDARSRKTCLVASLVARAERVAGDAACAPEPRFSDHTN